MFLVGFEGLLVSCLAWYETGNVYAAFFGFLAFAIVFAVISQFKAASAVVALAIGFAYGYAASRMAVAANIGPDRATTLVVAAAILSTGAHLLAFRRQNF